MKSRIIASILLFLAVELVAVTLVLTLTPFGMRVAHDIVPTPTPTPMPILTVEGTPPAVSAQAAYLLDADTGHAFGYAW